MTDTSYGGFDGRPDDQRRLDVLKFIAEAGGTLMPRRNPLGKAGHDFGLLSDGAEPDLKFLAARDYLEERYFDRVSVCPRCSSHHLNLREICPACRSSHYVAEPMLHHFRCGYVGPLKEFTPPDSAGKRICPKCQVVLKYLGTDHDQLGRAMLCIDCGTSFQDAPVSAVCLSCGVDTAASDLVSLEIASYVLTSLGSSAIRRGTLFERPSELLYIGTAPILRPTAMRQFLKHEANRLARFKTFFTLMSVDFTKANGEAPEELQAQILTKMSACLRQTDILGQIGDARYCICLLHTTPAAAGMVQARCRDSAGESKRSFETRLVLVERAEELPVALETLGLA